MAEFMFRLIIVLSVSALAGALYALLSAWICKGHGSLRALPPRNSPGPDLRLL